MLVGAALHNVAPWLIICGVIWAVAMGVAAGNYACTFIHRLPRGRAVFEHKPYCGHCTAPLHVRDLYPVVSALLLRHRCRYCGEKYPVSHTVTELLVGALFALAFLHFSYGEMFVLVALLGTLLVVLAAIEANDNIIMGRVLCAVAVCGMVLRTFADGSIFGFVGGAVVGAALGAIIWHRHISKKGHIYSLPTPALLFAVGGLCVGVGGFSSFLAVFFIAYGLLFLVRKPFITVAFGLAVLLPLL